MTVWYDPSKDGTIDEYIANCKKHDIPPCFKGAKDFQKLIELDYIVPMITNIRLLYNYAKGDEFYLVTTDYQFEGVEVNIHRGKKGIHKPDELLSGDAPCYEVNMINYYKDNG